MKLTNTLITVSLAILISACTVGPSDQFGRATLKTEDGKICVKQKVTGSQIPTRICGTPEEMALLEAKSQQMMRGMHQKAQIKMDSTL